MLPCWRKLVSDGGANALNESELSRYPQNPYHGKKQKGPQPRKGQPTHGFRICHESQADAALNHLADGDVELIRHKSQNAEDWEATEEAHKTISESNDGRSDVGVVIRGVVAC